MSEIILTHNLTDLLYGGPHSKDVQNYIEGLMKELKAVAHKILNDEAQMMNPATKKYKEVMKRYNLLKAILGKEHY